MSGQFKENIFYKRKSNPGDTTIEGRASNGITLDNTGNVFLYSSHDQNIINELTASNYTGSINISPNDDKSFIAILATSTDSLISRSPIDIQMGSTNYTTLNTQANPSNYILPTSSISSSISSSVTSSIPTTSSASLPTIEIVVPKSERRKLIDETLQNRDDLIIATLELPDEENLEAVLLIDEVIYTQFNEPRKLITNPNNNRVEATTPQNYPVITDFEKLSTTDPSFYNKVKQVANEIGLSDYRALFKVIRHETAGTYSPSIGNGLGYYGLIQFGSQARKSLGVTVAKLRSMTRVEQMDLVKRYFLYWKKALKLSTFRPVDLYLATFFPAALGKPDNYILQASGLTAYAVATQNPVFNRILKRPAGEALTVGKVKQYYQIAGML